VSDSFDAFDSFDDAYHRLLGRLLDEPSYHNAPRGFPSQEVLGVRWHLRDPLRRLVTVPQRRTNPVFNFAELLWYTAGRSDLEYLAYYAPSVRRFSADGRELTGTAYGPRIHRYGPAAIDQWEVAAQVLRADPDSKRAVIQIYRPDELLVPDNGDVACTLAVQFLLREQRLHAVVFMRANDVYRGMVSDVFSFTMLQELMARRLGVGLGGYTHLVGSLHLYEPDVPAARRVVLASRATRPRGPADRMPPMPPGDQRDHLKIVLEVEHQLRTDALRLDLAAARRLPVPDYWRHVLILFELYRQVRHGSGDPAPVSALPPLYRRLVLRRFPRLAGVQSEEEAGHVATAAG
jgi:thymidylate synthase